MNLTERNRKMDHVQKTVIKMYEAGERMTYPMLHLFNADDEAIIPLLFDNDAQKRASIRALRELVEEKGFTATVIVFEAWISLKKLKEGETLDIGKEPPPSQDPQRQDAVIILSEAKNQPPVIRTAIVGENGELGRFTQGGKGVGGDMMIWGTTKQ